MNLKAGCEDKKHNEMAGEIFQELRVGNACKRIQINYAEITEHIWVMGPGSI